MNRRIRLIAALGLALTLVVVLVYSSLAGTGVKEPVVQVADIIEKPSVAKKSTVVLEGIAAGPVDGKPGEKMTFWVTPLKKTKSVGKKNATARIKVTYEGAVPDAFRVGRQVIVKGKASGSGKTLAFKAKKGSLVTKCPSKYEGESYEKGHG